MHKTAHQQVLTLVGRPQQFKAGDWWPFAEIFPVRNQAFSSWKVVGLMHQGQVGLIQAVLKATQGLLGPGKSNRLEQFNAAHPVFHRHATGSLEHNWQTCGG